MRHRDDLTEGLVEKRDLAGESATRADVRHRNPLTGLDGLRIASPCNAEWSRMRGDDRARFCGECKQNVYNLTNMTLEEGRALLTRERGACVRYFQRHDGTILLGDCEVGVRRRRGRRLLVATAALAVATVGIAAWRIVRDPTRATGAQRARIEQLLDGSSAEDRRPDEQRRKDVEESQRAAKLEYERRSAEAEREAAATRQRAEDALMRAIDRREGRFVTGLRPAPAVQHRVLITE